MRKGGIRRHSSRQGYAEATELRSVNVQLHLFSVNDKIAWPSIWS